MSSPSLCGAVSSTGNSDDEEYDGMALITQDDGFFQESCDIVYLNNELLAAARDVERLSEAILQRDEAILEKEEAILQRDEAIVHRDDIIKELSRLRNKDKEDFEQRKNEMQAEMRMLRGMVQSLNLKLQGEREKRRQAMSRKFSAQSECEFLPGDTTQFSSPLKCSSTCS